MDRLEGRGVVMFSFVVAFVGGVSGRAPSPVRRRCRGVPAMLYTGTHH